MTAKSSSSGRPRRLPVQQQSWIILVVAAFFCAVHTAFAQIGTEICGCQPQTYTFTFNFDFTCDDDTVAGPGINETACLTEIRGQDVVPDEDLIPVTVQTIQIFEVDENNEVFSQTVRTGTFVNGSNFTYTSIISTISDLNDISALPRGLQLVITGLNNKEQSTIQTYIITYFNDCGIFPILTEGQHIGWTIFSELGDPPTALCPVVPSVAPATGSPETPPSLSPTQSPSIAPITPDSPTRSPIVTVAPAVPETEAPATEPPVTNSPVGTETDMPSCPPIGNGGKGKGKGMGGGKGDDSGGKGGKGNNDGGKGKGGKGYDEGGKGKGGKGNDGKGKGGKGLEGGKGKGYSDGLRKKEVYNGQMDRLPGETEDRLLATGGGGGGGVECPESPDDDYYVGKGMGKGKGDSNSMGGKGKGGKGTGNDYPMKKPKDSSKSMDMYEPGGKGKGKGGDSGGGKGKGGKGGETGGKGKGVGYYDDLSPKHGKGKDGHTDDEKEEDDGDAKGGKGKGSLI